MQALIFQNRRRWLLGATSLAASTWNAWGKAVPAVPVLAYHRFGEQAVDSMTVRFSTFDAHLAVLQDLGCQIVPMQALIDWLTRGQELPDRAVVLTADDGHRSQFEHMAPRLRPLAWKVTLFVYPSAISNASYAMTWDQVRSLQADGFRVESHTLWHPNFAQERRRQAPASYELFARNQLRRSRERLQSELGKPVRLLAWPFGVSDPLVQQIARDTGYEAAFSLGNRHTLRSDDRFALPRYLVNEAMGAVQLRHLLMASFG